ncbi:hypothetical protein OIU76_005162 [Salix suchowensis]|nr:hypothetical protein OIU76_005162 [Salix suchowensis]
MGISMNLVTYLVGELHISSAKSATIVTNFMGTLNLLGLLGGFLADAKLGRYLTVAIFASITALGIGLLTMATTIPSMRPPQCDDYRKQQHQCIEASGSQLALLYAALYTTALGGGGIKSNVSGFGSDQFDQTDPKEEKAMLFFFNSRDNGDRSSSIALWDTVVPFQEASSLLNDYDSATVPHTEKFKCLDKAAIMDDPTSISAQKNDPFIVSTVMEVEEVKMVLKLIPIWSTCILFWTVYSQMTTFTVEQATFMNRKVGSLVIPSGSYSTFLFITILLFTSLNERVFVPLARKLTGNAQGLTSLQRIGTGLSLSILAMMAAAVIEKERRETAIQQNTMISAFWLVPQYFLVGAGEAFAYVGQLEFFIREAPERMKSMSTGLFLSTISMGFFVSSLLVSLVDKATKKTWLRSNLNKGRLNNFYWMLALLGLLNLFVFLVFARGHQYKVQHYIKPKNSDEEELKPANDLTVLQVVKEEGTI